MRRENVRFRDFGRGSLSGNWRGVSWSAGRAPTEWLADSLEPEEAAFAAGAGLKVQVIPGR